MEKGKSITLRKEQVEFLAADAAKQGQTVTQRLHELVEQFKNDESVLKPAQETANVFIAPEDLAVLREIASQTGRSLDSLLSTIIELRFSQDFFAQLNAQCAASPPPIPTRKETGYQSVDW